MIAIVDSGPLYAATDRGDRHHGAALGLFGRRDAEFVIPAMVVAEVTYFVARRLGALAESRFLAALRRWTVEGPTPSDLERMAQLVERYADFPLGGTDASVVALAERLDTPVVVTLDVRHFSAVRPAHCAALTLLPEPAP